jgi:hypothetical protein
MIRLTKTTIQEVELYPDLFRDYEHAYAVVAIERVSIHPEVVAWADDQDYARLIYSGLQLMRQNTSFILVKILSDYEFEIVDAGDWEIKA